MVAASSDKYLLAGKYRLIAEIGRGGMADVYLAVNLAGMGGFQKLVVVKVLRQSVAIEDDEFVKMFLDEARLAARLNHPNVVQTNEVGEQAGRYYMVMEYLEGQTIERLLHHVDAKPRFTLAMRLQVLTHVLTALHYAHELADYDGKPLRVVHRDVSPSNVFVTYEGHTKLVDFGIAKALDSSSDTRVGMFKGKTRYMSPEQISQTSEIDRRSDVYGAGVVLWELASGTRMWKGVKSSTEVLRKVMAGEVPSLRSVAPDVPPAIERICKRALARSPANRYPTAAAMEADIEAYLAARLPRPADRDIGNVLKELFSEDRAKMRAAIETQLGRPAAEDESDLPSIPVALAATSSSSSMSNVDSSVSTSGVSPLGDKGEVTPVTPPIVPEMARPAANKGKRAVIVVASIAVQLALVGALAGVIFWIWGGSKKQGATDSAGSPVAARSSENAKGVRGVSDTEVLCGMSAAFSGPSRELGNRMKLGVETAFEAASEGGGIFGRTLRLIALDDGYEGPRAAANMKELVESRGIFAVIGNVGTPTAQVAMPYAVAHKTIFFGAFTGSKILRQEPPDRYVFNYRASYEEETAKMVHYLVDAKRVAPAGIVVFAQHDGYGDAGFDGVAKTMRKYGRGDTDILRVNYERNTVDIDGALRDLIKYHASVHRVDAVIMVATYKAAAKFIQKVKDKGLSPTFLNVSFVGSNALNEELKELGPSYAPGVIVTQVVPHPDSGGTGVLKYRDALARYHPDQQPDFVSLEGYVVGRIFAEGVRRAGRDLDTEKLVDTLESIHELDLGLGTIINYGLSEHQGSHKVWGTIIDAQGHLQSLDMD